MYYPTIEVDNEVLHRIQTGDVKLQRGQWIKLAWLDQRSRFVGVNPKTGTFWGVHDHKRNAFERCCEGFKRTVLRRTAN